MKNKKFLKAIAAVTLSASAAIGAFGFGACVGGHTHNYEWESGDANQHWKVCTEDGVEQLGSRADHKYVDGVCECGRTEQGGGPGETITYTVTFKNGETELSTATTDENGKVAKPAQDPTTDDETKRFNGWYSNPECTTPFDFNAALTADTTVYAGWRTVNEYDIFLETQGEKVIYNNDFINTETLETWDGSTWGEKGIYTYTNNKESADGNHVAVGGGKAELVDTTGSSTNLVVDFGLVTGVVEGYTEITVKNGGDSWTPLQFVGTSDAKSNSEVLGLRIDGGKIKYRLDGGNPVIATTLNPELSDKTYKIDFKFDLESGKVTIKIDGELFLDELDTTISEIKGLKFVSSDNGSKTLSVNYLAVANAPMELEAYRTLTLGKFETAYGAYDIDNKYTTPYTEGDYASNGAELTAAYNTAKTAIEGAETINAVYGEYVKGIAAMKAVPNDDVLTLIAAKKEACDEIDKQVALVIDGYTINRQEVEDKVVAAKAAINAVTKIEDLDDVIDAEVDKLYAIKSDATLLSEKKEWAKDELAGYKDAGNYTYTENKAAYDGAIEDGNDAIDAVTIVAEGAQAALTEVETKLAEAKAELDKVKTNAQMDNEVNLGQKKAAQKSALETYAANKKKADEGDTIIAGVIDTALESGKAAIDAVAGEDLSVDADAKAAVDTAYDEAVAAINKAVSDKKAETYAITVSGVTGVTVNNVIYGGTITAPAAPAQDGKLFDGWYTTEARDTAFDFATKIYGATTIWAKYVDIPTYATLSAQNNVVILDDFSAYAEGQVLATDTTYGTAGVYSSVDGAAVIIKDGANIAVKHALDTNSNINVGFGAVSGVVEGAFDWTPSAIGSSWKVWQLVNASGAVAYLNTADKNGTLELYVGSTKVTIDNEDVVFAANKKHTVYFKVDLTNGTLTVAANGKSIVSNYAANITSVTGMTFISSSGGSRKVTLDNLVINGTIADLAAHKTALATKLGDDTAVASAVAAVNSATTAKDAYTAYVGGLKAAADAAAAKALADAKTAALAEIEAEYPAANYTKNKTQYDAALALIDEATTIEEVDTKKGEALAAISTIISDTATTYVLTISFVGGGASQASLKDGATSSSTITVAEDATADTIKNWVQLASTSYEITGLYSAWTSDTEKTELTAAGIADGATIYVQVEEATPDTVSAEDHAEKANLNLSGKLFTITSSINYVACMDLGTQTYTTNDGSNKSFTKATTASNKNGADITVTAKDKDIEVVLYVTGSDSAGTTGKTCKYSWTDSFGGTGEFETVANNKIAYAIKLHIKANESVKITVTTGNRAAFLEATAKPYTAPAE